MHSRTSRRLFFSFLPALLILAVASSAIWGDHGLIRRHELAEQLVRANARLASVERENQRLQFELATMERDPVVLERVVAEELSWGQPGAVIYRFDAPAADRKR